MASIKVKISKDNRSEWSQPKFWQTLCPCLTIDGSDDNPTAKTTESVLSSSGATQQHRQEEEEDQQRRRSLLRTQGYVKVDGSSPEPRLVEKLREGIQQLVSVGLPASFIFLFDETWTELATYSNHTAKPSCHPNNVLNYDVLAWYIDDSAAGGSGFSPHRDRQPDNAKETFHVDGDAMFITHWIAITDATPESSCLYVIPKPNDPGYIDGDTEDEDPLRRALSKKQDYQCIRALPREAGTSLLFTHRIIHWGSSRDQELDDEENGNNNTGHNLPNRIAISFVYCDPSYEPCYLTKYNNNSSSADSILPFSTRLLVVCAQLLIYYQRFSFSLETIHACYQYCKDHEDELEQSYRQKVFVEYVKACKEEIQSTNSSSSSSSTNKDGGDSNDSENQEERKAKARSSDDDDDDDGGSAEEAMLEEMLNAEDGGYGEFEDDFDEEVSDEDEDEEEYENEVKDDEMELLRKEEKDNEDLLESIEGNEDDSDAANNDSTSRKRPKTT